MGTHALGDRPWLVVDDRRDAELALKAELLTTRRDAVLYTTAGSIDAATMLADLVGAAATPATASTPASASTPATASTPAATNPPTSATAAPASMPASAEAHPLERAARAVQEDLCLLQRLDDGWHLDASCLCFPTRWHLSQKVGKHIAAVHGPVRGYDPRINQRVDRLFDRLSERPVWRRNWFLMSDPALFQPDRPERETIIAADRVFDELFIRSERQTLRTLTPGWIVFTIRIQQEPLGTLLTSPERISAFADWVRHVSDDSGRRRHLTDHQRVELLAAMSGRGGSHAL